MNSNNLPTLAKESIWDKIKRFFIKDKKQIETNNYIVEMVEKDLDSYRGQAYSLLINNKVVGVFYADVLGCKEVIYQIIQTLGLLVNEKVSVINHKRPYKYASINSLDSKLYTEDYSLNCNACFNGIMFENSDIYFSNGNNCYLNSYKNDNYSSFLKLVSKKQDFGANGIVVYDINDNFDEFSSAELRRNFTAIYPQSYPVWRSILVGESSKDKDKIRTVLDFCGKDFSISKLERKNKKFVHCGPIEIPIYYQIVNEKSCYEIYISEYEKKYNITFPNEFIDNMIASGGLYSVLIKNKKEYISLVGNNDLHKVYSIGFDSECYYKMVEEFEVAMNVILDKYDKDSTMAVIPDFLNSLSNNRVITNESLLIGVDTIIERINSHEVTWYEKLPKLSLEIIKNGMFDNLVLIDNQECENIIGKKLTIQVPDKLTLSAGHANYILPLNKSFIGEQNEAFVAKAIDPSFPLSEDMEVKLVLEYSFGAENSYNLFLYPIDKRKNPPFEKIDVIWEKEEPLANLIYPLITDVRYDEDDLELELTQKIPRSIDFLNRHTTLIRQNNMEVIDKRGRRVNNFLEATRDIKTIINKRQRISHCTEKSKSIVRELVNSENVLPNIMYLIKKTREDLNNIGNDDKYKNILTLRLVDLEEAVVELSFDRSLFIDKKLMFPEAGFGRYFAEFPHDEEVLNIAYQQLVEMTSKQNFFDDSSFRRYINKMTGATAVRHQAIFEMSKTNPVFISYLLKVVVNCLKTLSNYDWNTNPETCSFYNNPKENGFLMRYCVELLISFLYCRELIYFNELRPGGRIARELVYYLKELNRNIMIAMQTWDDDIKKKKMLKTKYFITMDKPENLYKMWTEAYCLILYLTGDSRANYIKIGTGD